MSRPRWPIVAASLCLAALAVAVGVNPLSNNDIWLHLTTGRLILERGEIPRVDDYSFTRTGAPYVAHEWLAQVIFRLVFRAAGATGLILLKPIALALTAALVASACRHLGGGAVASFWAATLAIAAMASHLYARPHLFTFVMVAATTLLLARWRAGSRSALAALVCLQLLWTNLHGGFVLGPAMAALAGAWAPAIAMGLATFANPYGPRIHGFVLGFADPVLRRIVREWAGPFEAPFAGSMHFWIYLGVLALAAAAAAHFAVRRRWGAALTLGAFAALSFASKRNASLLGVAAAPWIGLSAGQLAAARVQGGRRARWPVRIPALAASCAAALGLALAVALFGVPHESGAMRRMGLGVAGNVPAAALDFITSRGIEGNALASYAFGSYVIYRAYPASRVFIDSRTDVYSSAFVEHYTLAMADPASMRDLMGRYRIDYAVLSWRLDDVEGPVSAFAADGGWALVFYDDLAMVYVRREPRWAALIASNEYRLTNPYLFFSGRSSTREDPAGALEESRRALAVSPSSLVARLMAATSLQALRRHAEALASLEPVEPMIGSDRQARALLYGLQGTSYLETGDDARARERFVRLLAISPDSAYARRMLDALGPGPPPGP